MSLPLPPDDSVPEAIDDDSGLDIEVLRRRREKVLTFAAIFVILAASAVASYSIMKPAAIDRQAIVSAAQQAVGDSIGRGLVFRFGNPVRAENQPDGNYLVRGEVLALTPAGASTHYWFDCYVRRNPDGSWGPARLNLLPQ